MAALLNCSMALWHAGDHSKELLFLFIKTEKQLLSNLIIEKQGFMSLK